MGYDDLSGGHIEVITGPMFAGKSEELIRRINRLKYAKKKFMVFKPTIDDRYSASEVVSHKNSRANSYAVKNSDEIRKLLKDDLEVVCIDEVQFFDEGIIDLIDELANRGLRIIVAGLDTDFRGDPFMITAKLLAKAEFVTKLTAICARCGKEATMTQRLVNGKIPSINDPVILVGASESYEPRCRHCHEVSK